MRAALWAILAWLAPLCTAQAGATFAVPDGWKAESLPWGTVLAPPEAGTHIAIVEGVRAADSASAAASAWQVYKPGFHPTLNMATSPPARNGWDEKWDYEYLTPPNARADVEAIALRAGAHWTVALIDGTDPTIEKRRADLRLIFQSLHPQGYRRESFAGRAPHMLDAARVAALLSFVQTSMRDLDVPGAGLALIDRGKVVYEGGLGVRELNKPEKVDAHTLFLIASNTKGMTTLLLSRLVDQKKLGWDEKVTDAYPPFRLGDAATTQKVLISDLVCACTGLPRQDLEWVLNTSASTPAANSFAILAGMRPTSEFGKVYQYSNLMAAAAGYVAASIVHPGEELGAAYDHAMQDLIFAPLGMHDTTFSFAKALGGNHASPHDDDIDGHPAVASINLNDSIVSLRPAGGAWSSAHDMSLYVQDELAAGKLPDGRRFISSQNLLARRTPGVSMGEDESYGMGLRNDHTYGVNVVHHGGALSGYRSDFFAIPSAGIGAVILTNADNGSMMLRPFERRLLEILYDGKPEALDDVASAAAAAKARLAAGRKLLTIPPDPGLVAQLATHYTNAALGHIDVRRDSGKITFDFGAWHSAVASRRNGDGSVSFITIDPAAIGMDFVVATQGGRHGLMIRDGQHEYFYAGG